MNRNKSAKIEKVSNSNHDNINITEDYGYDESLIKSSHNVIKYKMENNNDSKNLIGNNQSPIGISKDLLRVTSNDKKHFYGLSPISEIVLNFSDTNIDATTPVKSFGYKEQIKSIIHNEDTSQSSEEDFVLKPSDLCAKNTTPITKYIADEFKSEEQNLISNNFTLNSTSSSVGNISSNVDSNNRNISASRRLAARGAQRRLNIEPQTLNFSADDSDINNSTMNNTISGDDLSFYDDITTGTTTTTPTTGRNLFNNNNINNSNGTIRSITSTGLDDDDDENIRNCSNDGLLSYESSPRRFIVRNNLITIIDKNRSIDEIDSNSIDSGYGTFKFTEPKLPKKQLLLEPSPRKYSITSLTNQQYQNEKSPKQFRIFHSLSSGSMESMDDEYMTDLIEMESLEDNVDNNDDNEKFPSDLSSLISGHIKTIKTTPEMKRPPVRRCLSLTETNIQTNNSRIRGSLFEQNSIIKSSMSPKTPEFLKPIKDLSLNVTPYLSQQYEQQRNNIGCFKRPEPPSFSPIKSKRYKTESIYEKENLQENNNQLHRQRPILRKSMSLNDAQIMTALARSTSEPDLIGDFSKPFSLPLMEGRHRDLKSISCETVAKLIRGEFKDSIESYKIIDCRYPYEFDGGHIYGAQNLYTREQILNDLVKCKTDTPTVQPDGPKRDILIFHCEFSSERGPKLSRFLRNYDRVQNTNAYPALYYPEIYLLHNGYKEFYENFSDLCDPIAYRPMLEPSFGELYRQFRAKSKSWNGGDIKSSGSKIGLKKSRSRLVL